MPSPSAPRLVSAAYSVFHKILLRLPADLWLELREQAVQNHRSTNAEIVHRLRRSIEGYSR